MILKEEPPTLQKKKKKRQAWKAKLCLFFSCFYQLRSMLPHTESKSLGFLYIQSFIRIFGNYPHLQREEKGV